MRRDFKVLLLVYKTFDNLGLKYISKLLEEYKPRKALISLGSSEWVVPQVRTKEGKAAKCCTQVDPTA